MGVTLQELTTDTWRECCRLQVSDEEQTRNFSTNVYRIAQSRFDPDLVPCAIYNDEGEMVGCAVYAHQYTPKGMPQEPVGYWSLVHLMIDKAHQRKGYGKAAVEQVIKIVKQSGTGKVLSLSFRPENLAARKLYSSFGFTETGEWNGNEVVARLVLEE